MTDPRKLEQDIRLGLEVGAISYDGDPWYAASSDGGAGIGYDECERRLKAAANAVGVLPYLLDVVEAARRITRSRGSGEYMRAFNDIEDRIAALDTHLRGDAP